MNTLTSKGFPLTKNHNILNIDTSVEYKDNSNQKYYPIKLEGIEAKLFINKNDLNEYRMNALDWKKFFTILEDDDDLFGDMDKIIKNMNLDEESAKTYKKIKNESNGNISYGIFYQQRNYTGKIRENLHKLCVTHMHECDKDAYNSKDFDDIEKQYYQGLCNAIGQIQNINETGKLPEISTNNNLLTFVHPVYFLNHLKQAGLLDFNPYAGKKYSEILYGPFDPIYGNVDKDTATVLSNPGMTTLYDEIKDKDFKPVVYKGVKYCGVNGFFNAQYLPYHKEYKEYWHEGVDFRGKTGADVVSLVNGTVLRCGKRANNNQGFILIQSAKDENLFYLALHVDKDTIEVKKGQTVIPGQSLGKTVEIIDSSGKDVSHLHVSVIRLPEGTDPESIKGAIRPSPINTFPTWGDFKTPNQEIWKNMINPFNYDDTNTWKGCYK